MKTFQFKKEIWIWLILLIPFIAFTILQKKLPENMPTHFDAYNHVNGYMHPLQFILLIGGINILLYLLLIFLPLIDPKRANYYLFSKAYFVIRLSVSLMLAAPACFNMIYATGDHINIVKLIILIVLFFFIVFANYMGNIRPNWFVGIRTPWTLSNETVWRKTHQLSGRLLFFSALAGFIFELFINGINPVFVVYPVVTIGLIIPAVYSYFEYKKITKNSSLNQ
jgi:immunity protein, SdpI family